MRTPITWQPIAHGGTVYDLLIDVGGACWLATEAGLWSGRPGDWRPHEAQPLARVSALGYVEGVGAQGLLLAGGSGLAYSLDRGERWLAAYSDEVEAPITCIAVAPPLAAQRTVLAGTSGAGVLRSTDGGRSWRVSSAGLEEFVVLALAVAPLWGPREEAFALTTGGLYRSPNGGRYWKRALDSAEPALQAFAVSPQFQADRTVYAAGEQGSLLRSLDGGMGWLPVAHTGGKRPGGINSLLAEDQPGELLAGADDGSLWRSGDGGASWAQIGQAGGPILALASRAGLRVTGTLEGGLAFSLDGDQWRAEPALALRDLTRLARDWHGAALAYGPGGLWRAEGGGWRRLLAGDPGATLSALLPLANGALLVGTARGLLGLDAEGRATAMGAPGAHPVTAFAQDAQALWVGTSAGEIWRRAGGAAHWEREATLTAGTPVVSLIARADGGLVAATWTAGARTIRIWRRPGPAQPWLPWLDAPSDWGRVCRELAEPDLLGIGPALWRWDGARWSATELDGRPVVGLVRSPVGGELLAATTGGLYRRAAASAWERAADAVPPGGLLDLLALPDGRLLGLGRGGVVGVVKDEG